MTKKSPRTSKPRKSSAAKAKPKPLFCALTASCPRVGVLRRSGGGYPSWLVRFGAVYDGVDLRSRWKDLRLPIASPLDVVTSRPPWATVVEVGYRDVHGAVRIVPHDSPDTLEASKDAAVPLDDMTVADVF